MTKHPARHLTTLLCAPLLALALAGCGGLLTSEQPARQYYLLQPLVAPDGSFEGGQGAVLRLGLAVVPGLDTDRIQALDPDARLAPYANARWPDHLPEVVASVLRRSLESTGRFVRVEEGRRGTDGDWLLDLELRAFYGIRDSAGATGSVRVALAGTLRCGGGTHRLDFADSAPVGAERLASVVAAHQAALDAVTRQLLAQLRERCPATAEAAS